MKRKVAFISEHASPLALIGGVDSGGQNVYVSMLASKLAQFGFEIDIFTRWDNPSINQEIMLEPGVRVVHIKAGPKEVLPKENIFVFMDEFASGMIHFIDSNKINYELIHAHFWMSGYVAAIIKKILSIPYIITFHALGRIRRLYQGKDDGFPDERFIIEEQVAKEADMIIAECPQDMEDLIIHYMADPGKVRVIPCGFDKTEFFPMDKYRSKLKLGIDPSEFVILQLGRLVKRKGIDNVVLGVKELLKIKDGRVKLLIVGGESDEPDPSKTPEIARLMDLARNEKIDSKVLFTGRKERGVLKHYYNAADVFVTTPWYEPFGITPLESMACGTPVIGSNVGGIKFSVKHGETGFLVPPNDPELLAKRLYDLSIDKGLMRRFCINSVRRVNTLFTWERVGKMVSEIYEEVLGFPVTRFGKIQNSINEFLGNIGKSKILKEKKINQI
ncbi:glycosyl transferase, group 1 [Sporocytophaga myxococcoides]|uniref:Glycosyl transferase, group 1 n=1 Tax=Sporocytophaga myxococcoides TaxID=153721 RepID=A0A098LHQ9_9BACT|nr:glycosyltransferase family 1 protein [Sporocytophaga myxococcoides]GAL85957.1 glycosyl transferase, group 1 [Sporocytophaga myxococcoides]